MNGLMIFVGCVLVVFGFLQIILFFKLWGMTDDVREIKERYFAVTRPTPVTPLPECTNEQNGDEREFPAGLLVVELSTEKQMRLGKKLADGRYECFRGNILVGTFAQSEFMEFEIWVNELYRK